jgi:RND family efflux transporter MFP subunit
MQSSKLEQLKIDRGTEKTPPRRWLIPAAVLLTLVLAGGWWSTRAPAPLEVTTAAAREDSALAGNTVLNASGYVTARRQATVSSKFTGKVMDVLIEEGMQVKKGQVLARLDDANIAASFALAEAKLEAARTAGKETRALLRDARASFNRTASLVERKLASDADLDRTRAAYEALEAQLESKQAAVRVAEKELQVYRQQLADTVIRAPFAGIVVTKNAQPGEMISPNSAGGGFTRTGIGTIVDMDSLEIEIDVNEAYINRVTPGQKVVARLDAYPDWKIPCHVIAIIPTADRQKATVEVRVGFDALDPRILPDMGVKVAFQDEAAAAPARAAVVVPSSAVQRSNGKAYVWLAAAGAAERRAVAIVGQRDSGAVVGAGLAAGDRVIVNPPAGLENGMRVMATGND